MSLASNRGSLVERAQMLAKVREFFARRNILEVDTPILSPYAPIDAHIDVMEVSMGNSKKGFLHTSPEYGMKKLLSEGSGDIFQLGHVFRSDEEGPLHTPEFTMLEWYRVAMTLNELIQETHSLISLFLKDLEIEAFTYREAFKKWTNIDPFQDDLTPQVIPFSQDAASWDRDTQLHLLFSHLIEPKMGRNKLTVITHFPKSQAALAKVVQVGNDMVANRFEIYFEGVELANGFDELSDPIEQKRRLDLENNKRQELGKSPLPIDQDFIEALENLPDTVGVAVGFDRLMKLSTSPTSEQSEIFSQR